MVPQTDRLHSAWPDGLPVRAEIAGLPFFPQEDYQCGPAALATALAHFKVPVAPADLVDKVYLPARQGSLQVEMLAAPRTLDMLSYRLAPRFEDLLREVAAGTPVVVLQDYGVWPVSIWHYAVVAGYDRSRGELVLRSGVKERLAIPFAVFEYTWKESGYWAMVTMPPGRVPVTASEPAYLEAVLALERVARPAAPTAAYRALLDRWPANLQAAIGLANRHYAAGDLDAAEAVLRGALPHHPDSALLQNNLAQTLSDLGRDEEALRIIEPVVGRGGPFAHDVGATHATIVARLGRGLNLKASDSLGARR